MIGSHISCIVGWYLKVLAQILTQADRRKKVEALALGRDNI